jgi:CubicO group peptidase (beta-lactamase class C family)
MGRATVLCVVGLSAAAGLFAAQQPDLSPLAERIEAAMRDLEAPAVAIAVVAGDRVIYEKAFGYRDRERRLPATVETSFYITTCFPSETREWPVAVPYVWDGAAMRPIPLKTDRTMHAAGGMLSSVRDLSRWLLVNLSDGVLDGRRVFPREAMREVHSPQIGLDRRFGRLRRFAYGLGWYFGEDDGEIVVHHFGGYSGAQAHVSFMPDRGIGVAVVSNTDSRLPHLIAELIYDTLRGRPDAEKVFAADVAKLRAGKAGVAERIRQEEEKLLRPLPEAPPRPAAAYAGDYENEDLGTIRIREESGRLVATMGDLRAILAPARGDAFLLQWFPDDRPALITFSTAEPRARLTWNEKDFVKK